MKDDATMPAGWDERFHQLALRLAVAGAAIGFLAASIAFVRNGRLATETLQGACFALTAAIPVYYKYRRLRTQRLSGAIPSSETAPI
ncbi:hypothetical protein MalM25_21880 [Planctomycetes bacterium MalM25]|nr:hypothetical protein MalM25_21880 [Planctomycetes bacterium MalM25]